MTEEAVQVEEMARVNQEWPASLKEAVQSKVGRRGLTEFTVMAVQRELDAGAADLLPQANEARDLAQRLANVLATVVDHEARLTFLANVVLPDWVDTRSWPDEVLSRMDVQVASVAEEAEPEPEVVIDDVPEMKKIEAPVVTTRVETKTGDVGTIEQPVVIPEGKINAMDGPKYAALQHVHSPDGRCLKNLFIEKGEDGQKHCPLIDETPEPTPLPHDVGASGDNLFERLKQAGHLKPASALPVPEVRADTPEEIAEQVATTEALMAGQMAAIAMQGEPVGVLAETQGPDSGPLPEVPEESYAPDAALLPPVATVGDLSEAVAPLTTCPDCGGALDDGLCWGCGWSA